MKKVKVLVLGLGRFGHSWAASVLPACGACAELAAVVDKNTDTWQYVDQPVPKYAELDTALDETHPDLVVNVTPPSLHGPLNEKLLRQGYAVLCEKPIADSMASAEHMAQVLEETQGFLMIGENYRYHDVMRRAASMLWQGVLGRIHRASCYFCHDHPDYSMFYHGRLAHPLLEDVAVHHLDLARYLTGAEPLKTWCRTDGAEYSWYGRRQATAHVMTEMTERTLFDYNGTLAAPAAVTDWNGMWTLECDQGVMRIEGNRIALHRPSGVEEVLVTPRYDDSRITLLEEACRALREGRKGETDFSDNIRSFAWMRKAVESAETNTWVE